MSCGSTCSSEEEFGAQVGVCRHKRLFYGVLLRVAVGRRSVREAGGRREAGRLVEGKLLLLLSLVVGVVSGRSGECVGLLLLLLLLLQIIARVRKVIALRNVRICRLLLLGAHHAHFDGGGEERVVCRVGQKRLREDGTGMSAVRMVAEEVGRG